jgi:hypothetical protein
MTAGKQQVDLGKLRMSGSEFDRIMRKALQVKPDGEPEKKRKSKAKTKKHR